MKILLVLTISLLLISCSGGTKSDSIGKYKKQTLPGNFSYKILSDESNTTLDKNQLTLEINQKITQEQIATIADELYSSKPKQRRFYIFYLLPGMKINRDCWATSHFDPELAIDIMGSTSTQDSMMNKASDISDGKLIGKWHEQNYSSGNYVIYKKGNTSYLRMVFKDGSTSDDELKERKVANGTRYEYKDRQSGGEYFVLDSDSILQFYNADNKNFTSGHKLK